MTKAKWVGNIRTVATIKGKFSKKGIEKILGKPSWEWETAEAKGDTCGLANGALDTAGWGDASACGRIWIHPDGVCFGGGMNIEQDRAYALKMHEAILKEDSND